MRKDLEPSTFASRQKTSEKLISEKCIIYELCNLLNHHAKI